MQYCNHCGAPLEENAKFCSHCGQARAAEQTAYEAPPAYEAVPIVDPFMEEKKRNLGDNILTWGILSLVFANTGWLSLLGLIFGYVTKGKVTEYEALYGETAGKPRVGKYLAKAGRIVGLVCTILFAFAFVVGFIAGMMEAM